MEPNLQKAILALRPPLPEPKHVGFLEICAKAQHENVNSNIYAYFLDARNETGCDELFIKALLLSVQEALKKEKRTNDHAVRDFSVFHDSYDVIREAQTEEGNRIDLLLLNQEQKRAIIIENKLYHHAINPFDDYWNSVKLPQERKLGILLTLRPEKGFGDGANHFINILHKDWVGNICKQGLPYGLDSRLYTYLNDFFKTIEHLSMSTRPSSAAEFYFENASIINESLETRNSAIAFIKEQVESAAQAIDKAYTSGRNDDYRYIQFGDLRIQNNLYLTITTEDMLKGKKQFYAIIEANGSLNERVGDIESIIKAPAEAEGWHLADNRNSLWSHIFIRTVVFQHWEDLSLKIRTVAHSAHSLLLRVDKTVGES